MYENKLKICELLLPVLQETRYGSDIVGLEYSSLPGLGKFDEAVRIKWENGYTQIVNVTADSGIAMIDDIIRRITK